MQEDIRWQQRYSNFRKALNQLREAVNLSRKRTLNDLEKQGIIQAFEYTHELAWNTMKDFLLERGNKNIFGSKDATRMAYKLELINNGDIWMDMIQSRNKTSHTYNDEIAEEIYQKIVSYYFVNFLEFEEIMQKIK